MRNKQEDYGIRVEIAKNGDDLRYMITEEGIPIQDACLWLDFVSMNSYLTGERYAYALLRFFRYLKAIYLLFRYKLNNLLLNLKLQKL